MEIKGLFSQRKPFPIYSSKNGMEMPAWENICRLIILAIARGYLSLSVITRQCPVAGLSIETKLTNLRASVRDTSLCIESTIKPGSASTPFHRIGPIRYMQRLNQHHALSTKKRDHRADFCFQ
jgi:hypothetical protein